MKRFVLAMIAMSAVALVAVLPADAGPRRRQPDRSIQARWGGFFVNGESDFWRDNESVFSLSASDFDDTQFGLTYSHAFNRFFELDVNVDSYDERVVSDYLDFVDAAGFPIFHDSILETLPVTVGIRLAPFGRAKAGGKRPVLFVGAGAGVNFWRYEEIGDFIDFSDPANPIVFGRFVEQDSSFVSYALVGLEFPVSEGFNIGFEARYFSSEAEFEADFAGLGTLDLGGSSASVSANWRF